MCIWCDTSVASFNRGLWKDLIAGRKRKCTMGIVANLMPLTKLTNQIAEEGIYSMRKVELKD